MKKYLLGFITLCFFSTIVQSQQPVSLTSSEIFLQIKKLKVLGSVLYVGAHPDDENNYLLPYLAKEKLYRTAYLSLTRGEGGQNLIGPEQGIDLGLIRTQELLAARRIDGCEQYFTRAYEFGYSKTMDETLQIWDKEKLLEDVVWMIRKFKPDVIITRFPPDGRAGHGHHAASALIANEAFFLAADSTKFTNQFKYGVTTHQAKRIVWNTYNFGGNNTTSDNQLKVDVSVYNNLLGCSYGEIGAVARTMHKSQGEGRPKRRGIINEYFSYTAGEKFRNDLMDDVDLSWKKISSNNFIESEIDTVLINFNFEHPELSLPRLVDLYKQIKSLPKSDWVLEKSQEIKEIIEACSGVFIEAFTSQEYIVQGDSLKLNLSVANRKNLNLKINSISFDDMDTSFQKIISSNQIFSFSKNIAIPQQKKLTQPYWLEKSMMNNMFEVDDQNLIGKAESEPAYQATFNIEINGAKFTFIKPVFYKYVDPVRGELYQPLQVFPKLTISVDNAIKVSVNHQPIDAKIKFTSYKKGLQVKLLNCCSALDELKISKIFLEFNTDNSLQELDYTFKTKEEKKYNIEAEPTNNKEIFNKTLHQIKYDHIPTLTYFTDASIETKNVSVKTVGNKIGYIAGAGDKVPEALSQLGYEVDVLTEKDISIGNLQKYKAIISGIRAYNIYDWLLVKNEILNEYVKQGGNLIIQYIKSNFLNNKKIQAGPYDFSISAQLRVTEENAKVNFILPNHSVLNFPNKIIQSDFEHWIQERSTYQIDKADSNFVYPLQMNDSNDKPSTGSLAIAKYGKGNVVYLSLAMFRQLPIGNSGAFRLMANIIALSKN